MIIDNTGGDTRKTFSVGKDLTIHIGAFIPRLCIPYGDTTIGTGTDTTTGSDDIIGTPIGIVTFDQGIGHTLPCHSKAYIDGERGIHHRDCEG